MDASDNQNLESVAFQTSEGSLYVLQLTNCNTGSKETTVPLQLLIDEAVLKNDYFAQTSQHTTEELQQQPRFNPAGIEHENVTYCISNEELHKVIPQRKLKPNLNVVPVKEQLVACGAPPMLVKPSAPPMITVSPITETNKNNVQPKKRPKESKVRIVFKENVKEFKSKTCIIPNYFHIPDRAVPPRAIAVLPAILRMHRDVIYPRRNLPMHVRFGPIKGICTKICLAEADEIIFESVLNNKPIFFVNREEHCVTYVDVSDKDKSNWLGLLPIGTQDTANVWLYEEDSELYGISVKTLMPRVPLRLGYSKQYAVQHNLPSGQPILDLTKAFPNVRQCLQCEKAFSSEALLQKHTTIAHKNVSRRRYRCSFCTRTFSRLFSLRRHVARFCTENRKILNKTKQSTEPEPKSDVGLFTQSTEDNKLPSDESFQNYTTSLDFSTNLFDTDRMPNLDISGSSKSEDFNPYIGFKDDINLANDERLDSTLFSYDDSNKSLAVSNPKNDEHIFCPYCNEGMIKSKKRQHILRDCPKRRFYCECGQIFHKKDGLATHIHSEHINPKITATTMVTVESVKNEKPNDDAPYTCEECDCRFKRRGMLVNHLWRTHQRQPKGVPVKKRVLHYPCGICPKIYRAAAKRDHHVNKHHPDSQFFRAKPVEGEQRTHEPAYCMSCHRQYSTRAKLLQHIRARHPHLASPIQTKKKAKPASTEVK
ncbi:uncharacterized protein LOC113226834 [Hyposmocoma kahamanoa]|uniref:uncharacterized protein LOC113226834 n=1 Tax=Hyposmocoma kahamanoa TaxID=1477025 RepID=UPI000E6D80C2|nr:uncharacterized protein LOC113226834 [Hyposmocoma kahamanoa]